MAEHFFSFKLFLVNLSHIIWGIPLLVGLFLVGIYLSWMMRGVQVRYLFYSLKLAFNRQSKKGAGDISSFQSLMMSLAATIGIGNIAGVATAVAMGGVGSIFWMWVTTLVGMAIKYAEAILAVKYRIKDRNNEMTGGPMIYIEKGIGWKKLAIFFAIAGAVTALTTGNMVQSYCVSEALWTSFHFPPVLTGLVLAALTGIMLFRGIKWVSRGAEILVPIMAIFYVITGLIILVIYLDRLPEALYQIIYSAFHGQAAIGGFCGASVVAAIRMGVARGIFSSEAGLGSSSIVAAAAKTDTPGRQAMVSMSAAFIATFFICTMTGLVIVVTGVLGKENSAHELINGTALTVEAFKTVFSSWGGFLVAIGCIFFGYSTVLGWSYYGEKCVEYVFGVKSIFWYRIVFIVFLFISSMLHLEVVWSIADISNAFMTIPNLIGLVLLSKVARKEHIAFEALIHNEKLSDKCLTKFS